MHLQRPSRPGLLGPCRPPVKARTLAFSPTSCRCSRMLGLTALEGYLPQLVGKPSPQLYPIAYAVKLSIVALLAWHYRATWSDFRPRPNAGTIALGIMTGLLVCVGWVGPRRSVSHVHVSGGSRSAFDPFVLEPAWRWAFHRREATRAGCSRARDSKSFSGGRSSLRWMIDNEFTRVPIGKVTPMAGGRDLGLVFTCSSRMAAGTHDRRALGVAAVVDEVALCVPDQPCDGQPGAGRLCYCDT